VAQALNITVTIPGPLRGCCSGAAELAFPATNLRALLDELEQRYPKLHRSICDETGSRAPAHQSFRNTQHMRDRDGSTPCSNPATSSPS